MVLSEGPITATASPATTRRAASRAASASPAVVDDDELHPGRLRAGVLDRHPDALEHVGPDVAGRAGKGERDGDAQRRPVRGHGRTGRTGEKRERRHDQERAAPRHAARRHRAAGVETGTTGHPLGTKDGRTRSRPTEGGASQRPAAANAFGEPSAPHRGRRPGPPGAAPPLSVERQLPADPVAQGPAHHQLEVAAREPGQPLGEHRHALAVAPRHPRDVGAPEEAPRPEGVEDPAQPVVDVAEGVGRGRVARGAGRLDRHVGQLRQRQQLVEVARRPRRPARTGPGRGGR